MSKQYLWTGKTLFIGKATCRLSGENPSNYPSGVPVCTPTIRQTGCPYAENDMFADAVVLLVLAEPHSFSQHRGGSQRTNYRAKRPTGLMYLIRNGTTTVTDKDKFDRINMSNFTN